MTQLAMLSTSINKPSNNIAETYRLLAMLSTPVSKPSNDITEIYRLIDLVYSKEQDPSENKHVTCNYKRYLLQLLWFLEDTIKKCNTYDGEEKWYQARTLELLKRK